MRSQVLILCFLFFGACVDQPEEVKVAKNQSNQSNYPKCNPSSCGGSSPKCDISFINELQDSIMIEYSYWTMGCEDYHGKGSICGADNYGPTNLWLMSDSTWTFNGKCDFYGLHEIECKLSDAAEYEIFEGHIEKSSTVWIRLDSLNNPVAIIE